jgi:AraC-like DNA-binding protein
VGVRDESVVHCAPAPLRPYLGPVTGYRHEGLNPCVHRGLPSPWLTLVLPLDEPLELAAHPDPAQPPGRFDAALSGLHTRPALIATGTRQHGVQLALTPAGARALLGLPAAALASVDVELADVLGPLAGELTGRLREAEGWGARFAVLDEVLGRLAGRRDAAPPPEVAEAWRLTAATAGRVPVAALARHVGWSPRHLLARFRAETGLTPKEAGRVARFDRARRALAARAARGGAPDLAALAAAGGFADQAHLTREWRAFTGLPPTRWLAEEFRFLQDTPARAAARSGTSDHTLSPEPKEDRHGQHEHQRRDRHRPPEQHRPAPAGVAHPASP